MSTALALRPSNGALLPSAAEWQTIVQMADALFRSGLLPTAVKSPQMAAAIIVKGRELSIPAMYALTNIIVVQGKPSANAELMLALVYRDHGDDALRIAETTAERCVITYKRRSWPEPAQYTFTIEDARRAGLAGGSNPTWQKYPQAMLRARAISAVARMAFPDSIAGMHTPEEMGASVEVNADGEVLPIVTVEPVVSAPQLPASAPIAPVATNGKPPPPRIKRINLHDQTAWCMVVHPTTDEWCTHTPQPSEGQRTAALALGLPPTARLCSAHTKRYISMSVAEREAIEYLGLPEPEPTEEAEEGLYEEHPSDRAAF